MTDKFFTFKYEIKLKDTPVINITLVKIKFTFVLFHSCISAQKADQSLMPKHVSIDY